MDELTKQEAIDAMKMGFRVTHRFFSEHEWMKMIAVGMYLFEDGVRCTEYTFWNDRGGENWNTGWTLYKGK